jgi:hypothetical protein
MIKMSSSDSDGRRDEGHRDKVQMPPVMALDQSLVLAALLEAICCFDSGLLPPQRAQLIRRTLFAFLVLSDLVLSHILSFLEIFSLNICLLPAIHL